MLASALRFFLLIELASYVAVGVRFFDLSVAQGVASALAWMIGARGGFVGFTYAFASTQRAQSPPIGLFSALCMGLAEWLSFLVLFMLIQPFERIWLGRDRMAADRPVVLLVHGYGCNRGAWWWLRRHLERAGFAVATVNLEPPYTDIAHFVTQLDRRIESVCSETGCERLILVGHSMGGLVARAYLVRFGSGRVSRVVTLATPHAGTALAFLGIGKNARQMEPTSVWLKDLWRDQPDIPMVSIRTSHDNFVVPQDHQRYPPARDVELPALGHLAMLFSSRTLRALLAALEKPADAD